jgi:hypothetical protein
MQPLQLQAVQAGSLHIHESTVVSHKKVTTFVNLKIAVKEGNLSFTSIQEFT